MPSIRVSLSCYVCFRIPLILVAALLAASGHLLAQSALSNAAQPLITQAVDESRLTTLRGNTHPLARPEFDLGTAQASLPMQRMLLVLKRSVAQESALDQLLDDQQNKSSANYHKWLTPEDFGKQFGPTDADMATIAAWLQSHGFEGGTTKGRTVLEFSGSASQVQEAFHTTIHKFLVNGQSYWANANDPQIPTALTPAVAGIASLNNFPRKPMNVSAGVLKLDKATGKVYSEKPLVTEPGGCTPVNECYGLGPNDFATIYNVAPLWNAGIDGTGVTIAIVGETDIQMSDVQAFRNSFGLPANNPVFIWNGPDPGIQGDEPEADIDVQWSGGVAKGATIDFVISQSTETTFGTDLSAVYIVDQNLAPIMSESYGECELGIGTSGNQFYNALWQQASAQGITVFISAGDAGSAGCDNFNAQPPSPALYGLQGSGYASTPYNVAVGGTDFNDFSNSTTYWSNSNTTTLQSALSYIPETTWNDSCTNALFATVGFSTNPETNCNNSQLSGYVIPEGGSGGASNCTTPTGSTPASCTGGYARPSWQTGSGAFSTDGKRDLPDVSLFASNGFVGEVYLICEADNNAPCAPGSLEFAGFGGTSVSSPAFAGIMALVNQKTGERQGNANYVFYKLAQKSGASCTSSASEASTCIFNDVTVGTNAEPCKIGSPNCTDAGASYGILSGYNASAGYDMATGLGSVNAANLVNQWTSVSSLPSITTLTNVSPTTVTHGQPVSLTVAVKPESGSGTPTGTVSLIGPTSANNTQQGVAGFNLSSGTVTATTDMLPGGTYSLTAHYPGDATYGASDSSGVSVTVNKENSQPQVFLVTFDSNGNIISNNATTAVYGTPYILRVNVENAAGQMCAPTAASGATACPSGTVTMTDNGSALDAGTYTLNSYGYFEDQIAQLGGGTNNVKAAYTGDNSFNASSATNAIAITPAPTGVNPPNVFSYSVGTAMVASALVQSSSTGGPPTGSGTFYANGTALAGATTYQAGNQTGPPAVAWLSANFTSSNSAFASPGNYTITASYSGDDNYAANTSSGTQITVLYPAPGVGLSPTQQNVNVGSTATVSALVDTSNKTVYPTGTVTFVNYQTGASLSGPLACTSTRDSSGNYACQASFSLTVSNAVGVSAQYSGDANYPAATGNIAFVVANDFSITTNGWEATAAQGATAQLPLFVSYLGTFNGAVSNFTCSGLPAEATCSFNPPQVTAQGSTTLTITTTALGQARRAASNETLRPVWLTIAMPPLLGICFLGVAARRRRSFLPGMIIVASLTATLSCGGGGGGGGGSSGNPNPVPSISSLSPTQQAAGSQPQTLTINGSNFIYGSTATYNGSQHAVTYANPSQLAIQLSTTDMATTGSYPVVVSNPTPGGGQSNSESFSVTTGTPTGIFTITVGATSGSLSHTTTFTLTVQ